MASLNKSVAKINLMRLLFCGVISLTGFSVTAETNWDYVVPHAVKMSPLLFKSMEMEEKERIGVAYDYRMQLRKWVTWEITPRCQVRLEKFREKSFLSSKEEMGMMTLFAPVGKTSGFKGYGIRFQVKLD